MFFNTIDEYDKELEDIKSTLDSMEERLDEEPYSSIRKGNYNGLKEVYEIIRQDRDDFVKMMVKLPRLVEAVDFRNFLEIH